MAKTPSHLNPSHKSVDSQYSPEEVSQRKSQKAATKQVGKKDAFQQASALPRFLQKVNQKLDSSQVYQSFKLPGSQYTVQDQRGASQQGKIAKPLEKFFSLFEKLIIRRFEDDEELYELSEEDEGSFEGKGVGQWRRFFKCFRKRSVKRNVERKKIKDVVLRELIQSEQRKTLVADLILDSGRREKFVRIRLNQLCEGLLKRLEFEKGKLSADIVGDLFEDEKVEYLAIKASSQAREWVKAPTKGKMLRAAVTEEKVSQDLSQVETHQDNKKNVRVKKENKKRSKFSKWLFG